MKVCKIFIFLLNLSVFAFKPLLAQNEFYNRGSQVTVQNNGLIFVQGDFINTDNGPNQGLITNSGSITLSGNWTNNSVSTALNPINGEVNLNGAFQTINGTNTTTFNNLNLVGTNTKQLNVNTIVGGTNGVLNLTSRPLNLNSNTLTVTNPLPSAIIRTSGYVISETPATPGYGTINWVLTNNTGNYEFPFGTVSALYIPYNYNVSAAGVQAGIGSISASTYPTNVALAINNRPLPTGVNNLINNCNTEHAIKMIDRFWIINANNYSSLPNVTTRFTYLDDEWNTNAGSSNTITENLLNTWHYSSNTWTPKSSNNNSSLNQQTIASNTDYGVFTLGEYKQISITLLNVDSVICFGQNNGVIQFSTTTGYDANTYSWNSVQSTDTIKSNLLAGTYTIIANDALGCRDTLNNVQVFEPLILTQNLIASDYSICRNQNILLTTNYNGGTKPYVLNWSAGNTLSNLTNSLSALTVTPSISNQYFTILTDNNNCVIKDSVFINVNQLPAIDFDADPLRGCQPLSVNFINLTTNDPKISSYQWNFFQGVFSSLTNPNIVFNNAGQYSISLLATSDSGCVNKLVKNNFITVYPKPNADFTFSPLNTDVDILNPNIDFTNISGNYINSLWKFGDTEISTETNPSHLYNDVGLYDVTLIVSTIHNCVDSIFKTVEIKNAPVIYIPNAFSPFNADGINDIFTAKGINFYDFKMLIFNRWGEKIAETDDFQQGWDGKFKGQNSEFGIYVYQISLKFSSGNEKGTLKTFVGHVTLLN